MVAPVGAGAEVVEVVVVEVARRAAGTASPLQAVIANSIAAIPA
jgi:hypothetical protein